MARRYLLPIRMARHRDGSPSSFLWRGQRYRVVAVFNTWHLRDRWWEVTNPFTAKGPADRRYWRVECQPYGLQCELFYDQAQNAWVLDRVLD